MSTHIQIHEHTHEREVGRKRIRETKTENGGGEILKIRYFYPKEKSKEKSTWLMILNCKTCAYLI